MKTFKNLSILVLLAAVLMTGCAPAGGGAIQLDGTSWTLVEIDGEAVLPNSGGGIRFEGDTVSGSGGCNTFSGSYTLDADGGIQFGPMATTMMACEQDLMDQESAFNQTLAEVVSVSLQNGRLTMEDAAGSARLVFEQIAAE